MKNMNTSMITFGLAALAAAVLPMSSGAASPTTKTEAQAALRKAVGFFQNKAGYRGAYLYKYSADLKKQEGEGLAYKTTGWTQPPGTPYVGEAYLYAYQATGEAYLLDAAKQTAYALVASQLRSGGWDSRFELGAEHRKRYAYRTEPESGKRRNYTTLDDNKSQSCLMFLMHMDEELKFKDKRIRDTLDYAFDHFLKAQYPNGAWPQQFREPPVAKDFPVKKARYPDSWSRTYPKKRYTGYYTFNDNTIADMLSVLLEAHRIYGGKKFFEAARKTGDFMLLAQMPEPQPGWAQQYNANMEPAWARKFEPASISGGESQGVMRTLITMYRATGDKKYLDPIPRALAYYKRSQRPDGKLARFYELKTNKPLYLTKDDYKLTYSDANMPTHYGFIVSSGLGKIESEYKKALETPKDRLYRPRSGKPGKISSSKSLSSRAKSAIDSLDRRGAWVEKGTLKYHGSDDKTREIIDTRTVVDRVRTLAQFISASK
jgi:hypothetical protein